MPSIAIIGMACRYPDALSPRQLWENTLAQRRSFRRIPQVRLCVDDYSADHQSEDRIYLRTAAVLEDYEFDRVRFQVSKETFASTDLVHWLALDIASQALEDAKVLDADDSRRERMGVYIGNSLTGEFSRANLLRLRWPYLRRVLTAVLQKNSQNGDLHKLLDEIETLYKTPFPATTEESLAGGLSNTIAGRICNYFNLKGGGYTVDGACASSLLAVANACSALESGDVDVAIAGGVDLSLDPFELAGFSKLGALATKQMRIFDAHSEGFWPGEGCGIVVLMRHEEAVAHHHSPYAVLRGWGISSDGSGGITRPEASGQLLALRRAYHRAGYGIDSVAYIEGHGTGTVIGDAVELQALSQARREANSQAAPAAIGSIKANIGHTKAAAGVAGLIKATMAVRARVIPPTTGCDTPHSELTTGRPALRILRTGELWPDDAPVRSGVSAMGFGGINTHITLEACDIVRRKSFTASEQNLLGCKQDCELFLFQATDAHQLSSRLQEVLDITGEISFSEMADLAASLAGEINPSLENSIRAACIASTPDELEAAIKELQAGCATGKEHVDSAKGIFLSARSSPARIAFLFPGQGSPVHIDGGIWSRRFPGIRDLYHRANLPLAQSIATETAQPCVVTASLAGLHALELSGIEASVALGHSLGEITALYWAGMCQEEELLRVVQQRGRIMAQMAAPRGAMASIRAGWEEVKQRLNGDLLAVAAHNSPLQTVVSGRAEAVERFAARVSSSGITATMLPVSHAFHSPLVAEVATGFSEYLRRERFAPLRRRVVSTVTGSVLASDTDLHELLNRQITMPVQFAEALSLAAAESDLLIEVGSGTVLSSLAAECMGKPVIPLNVAGESLRGLLLATGAAFALGADIRTSGLFGNRFVRPFDLKRRHSFLQNPCETVLRPVPIPSPDSARAATQKETSPPPQNAVDVIRNLVAQRTELPLAGIKPESRFLDDLHLNSITVSQLILQAATQLDLPPPAFPTEYSNATIAHAAETLEQIRSKMSTRLVTKSTQGVEPWLRALAVELVKRGLRPASLISPGAWQIFATHDSPLQAAVQQQFRSVSGSGAICCVPCEHNEQTAAFLLESVQTALKQKVEQIVFLQDSGRAAALARTLYLEHPSLKVTVVNVPDGHANAAAWAAQEANTALGFTEVHYDDDGIRREPRLKMLWPDENVSSVDLGPDDVLLVTGGGKGIAAECALELARESKCRLAILGRSEPARDHELKQNLLRLTGSGVSFRYSRADVTDAFATFQAIRQIEAELGSVTAVLHGAGINHPKRLEEITPTDLQHTLAPKLTGLRNLLDILNPKKLRLLLTFGSIIARTGLHGEGHYGLANDWMATMVGRWQDEHPDCRCLNLDWSVWAGAGMGQRLGVLDSLIRQGITPLPLDQAIRTLKTVLGWKQAPASFIVAGRFGDLPTLRLSEVELPLRRFLEHVQVYYPGIELIAEAGLSTDTDPYIGDHVFQGEQLLPAVCGIEAMAQIAMALENSDQLPEFENLRFQHPIVIPKNKSVRIRIAALRRQPGVVAVAIRCSSTSFQIDHFTAECRFQPPARAVDSPVDLPEVKKALALDPARDLYGNILFHQGRFRRIDKYFLLHASQSLAELAPPSSSPWYARHLPGEFIAGDPSSRDAALHSIQACIPHKTILPVGIDRIIATRDWTFDRVTVNAVERSRDGESFIYDVSIQDSQGHGCERWEGLHLRAVAPTAMPQSWPLPLLAPYLERKLSDFIPTAGAKVMLPLTSPLESGYDIADSVGQVAGPNAMLGHRPDGKPEVLGSTNGHSHISLAHSGPITLVVSANHGVGCDLEPIAPREATMWKGLLGEEGFALAVMIAEKFSLALDIAATHVWTLKESLRKSGAALDQPLRVESASADHWILYSAGKFAVASFHTQLEELRAACAFGFAVSQR
ncbi:MAG TPA: SDR family NAD(P)-dependent oxidoreductase [Candidatus Angelobacter sp.]